MTSSTDDLSARKQAIREAAHANRKAQPDKDAVSVTIVDKFMALPEYAAAKTVMFYVDVRDEVRTRQALRRRLQATNALSFRLCRWRTGAVPSRVDG